MTPGGPNPGPDTRRTEHPAAELFNQLVDLPEADRASRLADVAPHNPDLSRLVQELLLAHQQSSRDLPLHLPSAAEGATAFPALNAAADPLIGAVIGAFRLLRFIGAGGMGQVYEASQQKPARKVAVKLVRTDHSSSSILRRFDLEAQVLSSLDHPGIARIIDVGRARTDSGNYAYMAMELVDGTPLTEFCRQHRLNAEDRARAIMQVCAAVEHAHRRGVIHRDLKPANVLMHFRPETSEPECKVLDFGVARWLAPGIAGASAHTLAGQLVGTLAYMSPEQASGNPVLVDTRSDVYSIGVILNELLTGKRPIDTESATISEAIAMIGAHVPPRINTLDGSLSSELALVVHKALAKHPADRYQSAAALGEDLRRYLASEPLTVRPASAAYLTVKFLRRRPGLSVAIASAILATVLGIAFTLVQNRRARIAEATADTNAADSRFREYAAIITGAQAAIGAGDTRTASALLRQAPRDLRGWEWSYLNNKVVLGERVFGALYSSPSGMAVSPDGRFLAGTSAAGSALWDSASGAMLWHDARPAATRVAPAFAHRQPMVACALREPALLIASPDRPDAIRWALPAPAAILAFEPDDRQILVVCADGTCLRLDPASGTHQPCDSWGTPSAISRDGTLALSVSGTTLRIGAFGAGPPSEVEPFLARPTAAAFNSDGSRVIVGSGLGEVGVISTESGQLITRIPVPGGGAIEMVALSDNGQFALVQASERTAMIIDLRNASLVETLRGHEGSMVSAAFSPDQTHLFSAGVDLLQRWALPSPQERDRDVDTQGTSTDGSRRLIATGSGHPLTLVDAQGSVLWQASVAPGFWRMDPLATKLARIDVTTRTLILHEFDAPERVTTAELPDNCTGLWWSNDSALLAVRLGSSVTLHDGRTLRLLHSIEIPDRPAGIAFSPDSRHMCVGRCGGSVLLYQLDPWKNLATLPSGGSACVCYDSPGKQLAVGAADGVVTIWDTETLTPMQSFRAPQEVESLYFLAEPNRMLIGSAGTASIWETRRARQLLSVTSIPSRFIQVCSPDAGATLWSLLGGIEPLRGGNPAQRLVDELLEDALTPEAVDALLAADTTRPPSLIAQARAFVPRRTADPRSINHAAWMIALIPDRSPAEYQQALRMARIATDHAPFNAYFLNTLALCQFRVGLFNECLTTLERSGTLLADFPPDLALRVLVLIELDRKPEAEKVLAHAELKFQASTYGGGTAEVLFVQARSKLNSRASRTTASQPPP